MESIAPNSERSNAVHPQDDEPPNTDTIDDQKEGATFDPVITKDAHLDNGGDATQSPQDDMVHKDNKDVNDSPERRRSDRRYSSDTGISPGDRESLSSDSDADRSDIVYRRRRPRYPESRSRSRGSRRRVSRSRSRSTSPDPELIRQMAMEAKIRKAPKRARQFGKYVQLLESRLRVLEQSIQSSETKRSRNRQKGKKGEAKNGSDAETGVSDNDDPVSTTLKADPRVNRLSMQDFMARNFSREAPHCTIDVGLNVSATSRTGNPSSGPSDKTIDGIGKKNNILYENVDEPTKFIQINSDALTRVLAFVCQSDAECPYVIYSPYKSIVYYEKELREYLDTLEKIWTVDENSCPEDAPQEADAPLKDDSASTELDAATPDNITAAIQGSPALEKQSDADSVIGSQAPGNEDGKSGAIAGSLPTPPAEEEDHGPTEHADANEKSTEALRKEDELGRKSKQAYLDLKCLLEFYEEYAKPRWSYFRSNLPKSVRYNDLWALFQPGDDVYISDMPQKIWRVVRVTGGRPKLDDFLMADIKAAADLDEDVSKRKSKGAKEEESEKWTIFHLDCVYYDFDGKEFGPIHKAFTIPFFSKTKEVISLNVCPLRLLENVESKRKEHIKNGKRFLDLTKVVLQYYEGRTLTEFPHGKPLTHTVTMERSQDDPDYAVTSARPTRSEDVDSQVMIDFDRAFQYNPDWAPSLGMGPLKESNDQEDSRERYTKKEVGMASVIRFEIIDYWDLEATREYRSSHSLLRSTGSARITDPSELSEDDLLLLPDRVFGYILRDRRWGQ